VLAGLLVAFAPNPASAAEAEHNAPDWAFGHPGGEFVTTIVSIASLSTILLPQRHGTWGAFVSWEDDPFYGSISDFTGAFVGSVIAMTAGYFLDARYLEIGGSEHPYARSLRTTLIDVEAVTLATGISFGIKRLTGRCRPRAWKQGKCGEIDTDYDAFPSGHTTPIAAVAGARFGLAINSTGARGLRYTAFGIAEGMAVGTAFLRVAAGAHSWEDVLGGWILGHATGLLLSYVHPIVSVADNRPSETSQPLGGLGGSSRAPSPAWKSSPAEGVLFSWGGSF
jgi:membrane-associated phospholipid phosphatase